MGACREIEGRRSGQRRVCEESSYSSRIALVLISNLEFDSSRLMILTIVAIIVISI